MPQSYASMPGTGVSHGQMPERLSAPSAAAALSAASQVEPGFFSTYGYVILAVVVVLIIVVIGYMYYTKSNKKEAASAGQAAPAPDPTQQVAAPKQGGAPLAPPQPAAPSLSKEELMRIRARRKQQLASTPAPQYPPQPSAPPPQVAAPPPQVAAPPPQPAAPPPQPAAPPPQVAAPPPQGAPSIVAGQVTAVEHPQEPSGEVLDTNPFATTAYVAPPEEGEPNTAQDALGFNAQTISLDGLGGGNGTTTLASEQAPPATQPGGAKGASEITSLLDSLPGL